MKHYLRTFGAILFFSLIAINANAQCPNDNVLVAGNLTPPGVSLSTTQTFNAGQYMLCYVEAGANYTATTCSLASWDTQITIYEDVSGNYVAYNDDACAFQSSVSFTPVICGYVRIELDQFYCSNSGQQAGVMVTMNSAGTLNPTLTAAPDQTTCYGNPDTIGIANNGSGGVPPYTYSWLPTTNLASPSQSISGVTTVTTTTVYTLTITDQSGCVGTDQVQVSVLAAPPINLGNDTTFCGTSLTLNAGNPGSSYLWSTGAGTQTLNVTQSGNYSVTVQFPSGCVNQDNIVVTINTPPSYSLGPDTSSCSNSVAVDAGSGFVSYTWSTGGTSQMETVNSNDTISVTVVDANGCVLTDTIGVVLNPAPIVNLGADITQCGGSATVDAGNPGALFFWSNSTSSQTTNISSTGSYYVDVLTPAGCAGSDTINVTINYQPVANLGPDTTVCVANVILDAGNPGSTYAWSNTQTSQVVTVGSGTFSVLVTDPSGCSVRDTIIVTTNTPPVITAGQDTAICTGGTATLNAGGGLTYLWSNGATGTPTTVSPTTPTSYYVTGTDANGCQASDLVIVTLLPASNAQFTASVTGATANFTNQSTGAFTYSWDFGDASALNTTASPSHVYTINGTYTVTLTVTGACGTDTYTQTVTITQVGIENNELANTLTIYPNPNDGQFTISFEFAEATEVTVQLTDISGRVISTIDQQNVLSFTQELGDGSLSNGIYFVNVITADGVVTRKVTVQK